MLNETNSSHSSEWTHKVVRRSPNFHGLIPFQAKHIDDGNENQRFPLRSMLAYDGMKKVIILLAIFYCSNCKKNLYRKIRIKFSNRMCWILNVSIDDLCDNIQKERV